METFNNIIEKINIGYIEQIKVRFYSVSISIVS